MARALLNLCRHLLLVAHERLHHFGVKHSVVHWIESLYGGEQCAKACISYLLTLHVEREQTKMHNDLYRFADRACWVVRIQQECELDLYAENGGTPGEKPAEVNLVMNSN
jgi:hypothetical protein